MSNEIEWLRGLLEKATPGPWHLQRGFSDWNMPTQHDITSVADPQQDRDLIAGVPSITPNPLGGNKVDKAYARSQAANARLLATLRNIAPALVDVLEMTSHEHDVRDNWEACPSCATIERAVAAIRAEMERQS